MSVRYLLSLGLFVINPAASRLVVVCFACYVAYACPVVPAPVFTFFFILLSPDVMKLVGHRG